MPDGSQPLSIQGLSIRRGPEVLIGYPDFTLPAGADLAVTGSSGLGKTTLLYLLAGLLLPTGGAVRYGEQTISALSEAGRDAFRRQHVGFLFQEFHLMSGLTALENVELGLRVAGMPGSRQRAAEALQAVGLGDRLGHRPEQLSTGQKQRVAVARATAHRPGLILADEPTAHLDPARSIETMAALRDLAASLGATLITVTHDPKISAQFSQVLDLSAATVPAGVPA